MPEAPTLTTPPSPILPNSSGRGPLAGDAKLIASILDNPNLPSPPSVALQIVELASDYDADIKDVVRILKVDPAICGKLLKTVNSCIYGLRQPVVAIERAVSIVGFHPLRSLVLGLALPSMQARGETETGLRSFWRESVAGAMMARELAVRSRDPQAEEIFLAGLLRDLGVSLLRQRFDSRYDPVWKGDNHFYGRRQCDWERASFGLDHAELSAALLTRWRLPPEIVEPVRYHHYPESATAIEPRLQKRAKLLDFCSRMARIETLAEDADALQAVIDIAEADHKMSIAELEKFLEDVCPKIEAFAEILNIEMDSCSHFGQVMAAGCAELARLSVELSLGHSQLSNSEVENHEPDTMNIRKPSKSVSTSNFLPPEYSLDFIDRLKEPDFRYSISQYRIESVLGRGGMGVVLRAFEPALQRQVALKMITPELANRPRVRDRFAQEARTAASILHENVVTIFTIDKYRGVSFLVMEFVDGISIQDHFKGRRKFRPSEIVRIGRDCALGLAAAHKLGVIHRDIKPGNILLRRQGERAQLTDFGLACVVREAVHYDSSEPIWGTPEYMSPEQSEGSAVNFATDLYSLGGALFAMCTGSHPIPWSNRRDMPGYSLPNVIRRANGEIPDDLIRVIVRLMSPSPDSRYQSAEETAEVLTTLCRRLSYT